MSEDGSADRPTEPDVPLRPGDRIVVSTPDRREFGGELVELRSDDTGRADAVVRLDTGWMTTYPATMVRRADDAGPSTP